MMLVDPSCAYGHAFSESGQPVCTPKTILRLALSTSVCEPFSNSDLAVTVYQGLLAALQVILELR